MRRHAPPLYGALPVEAAQLGGHTVPRRHPRHGGAVRGHRLLDGGVAGGAGAGGGGGGLLGGRGQQPRLGRAAVLRGRVLPEAARGRAVGRGVHARRLVLDLKCG